MTGTEAVASTPKKRLKALAYLRTSSATHAEKSTVQSGRLNAVSSGGAPSGMSAGASKMSALDAAAAAAASQMNTSVAATDIKFCAIDDPGCEACQ